VIYFKYLWVVLKHKWYVFVAGRRIGGIPLWRLITHDLSKFLPLEFISYANYFCNNKMGAEHFTYGWLSHQNRNPHHWEYWIPRTRAVGNDGGDADIGVPLDMPETYVREMLADWLAASKAYTLSWDISEWYKSHKDKLRLSDNSWKILNSILVEWYGERFIDVVFLVYPYGAS